MAREFKLLATQTFNAANIISVTHWRIDTEPPSMFIFDTEYLNIKHPDFNEGGFWVGQINPLYKEVVSYCEENSIPIIEAWDNFKIQPKGVRS